MKKIYIIFLICVCFIKVEAQLMPFNDHYIDNMTILNPASFDLSDQLDRDLIFSMTYRMQWLNLPDGPKSFFARVEHVPLNINSNTFTYGGYLINDNAGAIGLTGVYAKGSYVVDFSNSNVNYLSLGLTAGFLQYRVDASSILQGSTNTTNINNAVAWYPDLGVGIYYYTEAFHIGFSSPQIMSLDTRFQIDNTNYYTKRLRHYFINIGGYIRPDADFDLKPEIWIRYVSGQASDVNSSLMIDFGKRFYAGAGVSVRQGQNESFLFSPSFFSGVKIPLKKDEHELKIGASYTNSSAIYNAAFGATFEMNVVYYIDYAN
ncbi:MAG: PorP/SprF family type IX secretion system membrane protein [Saprospiraceae bacterium]